MTRRLRWARTVVAVGFVAVVAAACSSTGSVASESSTVTTVDGPDAGGLGTPIVEGLDVQPGSRLLGTVFPAPDTASTPDVRVALIEVEGDPADIARFYMEGLTSLGYRFASTGCGDNGEVGPIIVCETPGAPDTMADDWASMLLASPGDGPARFTTTIQLVVGSRTVPDDPTAGSSTLPRPPGTVITPAQAIDDIGGIEPVTVDPPGVGERIADASFDGGTGLVVEPGDPGRQRRPADHRERIDHLRRVPRSPVDPGR